MGISIYPINLSIDTLYVLRGDQVIVIDGGANSNLGKFEKGLATASIRPDGKTVATGDVAGQTRCCIEIIQAALEEAGSSFIRIRTILRNIDDWETVAKVRSEYFKNIKPVDTVMQISTFVDPEWLIEIEVDAIVD